MLFECLLFTPFFVVRLCSSFFLLAVRSFSDNALFAELITFCLLLAVFRLIDQLLLQLPLDDKCALGAFML